MNYVKAQDVLPEEILKIIQEYVDGKYLYVPRKNENHKAWGEKSGIKNSLKARNNEIYKKYINGATINVLTQEYYLSDKSIRRIISQQKLMCSQSLQNHSLDWILILNHVILSLRKSNESYHISNLKQGSKVKWLWVCIAF